MTINQKKELGFYLHYKGPPIPKYSYYFAAKDNTPAPLDASWYPPAGISSTKISRQFTAHTIPEDTERCGHWNVFNPEQLESLLEGTDGTLMVVFQFDEDKMTGEGNGDLKFRWTIPNFRHHLCSPFTSRGITANNQLFVIRIDRKANDGDYFAFVFSRSQNLPPMAMKIVAQSGAVLGSVDKPEEGQALPPLMIKRDDLLRLVSPIDTLVVELIVFKGANPLEQLNNGGKFESVMSPAREAPKTAQVGSQQYVVVQDDL
eukprot:GDKJ01001035.1.p1 GENE.GDKJ01001035.1~~GDKJ01001035.1.p1  ORF type:complete len:269 (+),score=15.01 GDKJ01001035.1:29-808(+)